MYKVSEITRKWTNSVHVENIFEILGKNDPEKNSQFIRKYHEGGIFWPICPIHSDRGFGFVNPRASKSTTPYGTKALSGDVRCETDYAETILIIDNPAYFDLLSKVGAYELPHIPKDSKQVFLALHPDLVDAHPEIHAELDAVKEEGNLFDIRDWQHLIVDEQYGVTKWLGEAPLSVMEPLLATRLAEAISSIRGYVMKGYTDAKYGQIKNMQDVVALANILMLDKSFIVLPSLASGKNVSAKSVWSKICKEYRFDFSCAVLSKDVAELSHKIDMVESAVRLWNNMYEKTRMSVCIDEKELGKHGFIYDRFEEMAKVTGMDSTIDALKTGIDVRDLLA